MVNAINTSAPVLDKLYRMCELTDLTLILKIATLLSYKSWK